MTAIHTGATINDITELANRICQRAENIKRMDAEAVEQLREAQYNAHKKLQAVREIAVDLASVGPCESLVYSGAYYADANYHESQECGSSGKLIYCSDGEYRYLCEKHEVGWSK